MPPQVSFRDSSSHKTKPGPSNRSDSLDSTKPAQPSRSLWKRAISTITTRLADGRAEYHAHIAEGRKELEKARRMKEKLKGVEKWRNDAAAKGVKYSNEGEGDERKEERAGGRPGEDGEKRKRRGKKGNRRTSRRGGDGKSDNNMMAGALGEAEETFGAGNEDEDADPNAQEDSIVDGKTDEQEEAPDWTQHSDHDSR